MTANDMTFTARAGTARYLTACVTTLRDSRDV